MDETAYKSYNLTQKGDQIANLCCKWSSSLIERA